MQLPAFSRTSDVQALAYVVIGPRVRGKFDVDKAVELGIPFGPLRAKLTKGESITFKVKRGDEEFERTVKPEECIGPSETPGVIIVLDVPSTHHIPDLVSSFKDSEFFRQFLSKVPGTSDSYAVRNIFHLCGDNVLGDERYKAFMKEFAPDVNHVVASREHCPDPVTFTSAAFNQLRLSELDNTMFPVPKYRLDPETKFSDIAGLPEKIHIMASNLYMNMRPPAPPIIENLPGGGDRFHPAVKKSSSLDLSQLTSGKFAAARLNVANALEKGMDVPKGAEVGVLPLGTGSALPSKYRNVSSTLIQIPGWGNILLDAGESTWGQLVRYFGTDDTSSPNVWDVLRNLKCVFISHIHADHHLGLSMILTKRRSLNPLPTEPLYIVTIRGVNMYLRELSDIQDLGLNDPSGNGVVQIQSEALHYRRTDYATGGMWQVGGNEPWVDREASRKHSSDMCRALGLESFKTVDVYHNARCYGCVVTHVDGWSIVFSGDTQPTDNLVRAGRGATLLIHEATMADDQEDMAKRKGHSTFGQAITIGKRMKASNILLTHFSARYPKMPPSGLKPRASGSTEPTVAVAFDHVNLTIGNMWKIGYYLPALQQSFYDTIEEGDEEEAAAIEAVDMDCDLT